MAMAVAVGGLSGEGGGIVRVLSFSRCKKVGNGGGGIVQFSGIHSSAKRCWGRSKGTTLASISFIDSAGFVSRAVDAAE